MENQINVGDQNTQQTGSKINNQTVQIPEKSKVNYWMISTLILAVLFFGIWGLYVFFLNKTNQPDSNITPTQPPLSSEFACSQDDDCVIGIQATSCCSCPEAVNKEVIGTKDWEQYEFGKDYSSRQPKTCGGTVACKPCELPEKPICQNGQCQFSSTLTSQESCKIGKEYENTAVNPVKCKCPEGYKFETLSMGWGPCPQPGMRDCPSSILKCVTTENIPGFSSQDLEKGWYWGFENQRKPSTPNDWIFTEAGRSSCWHKPQVNCF